MGFYRLLLAYLVVFSHTRSGPFFGFNFGIVAVISFFLLSGFVMTALIERYYLSFKSIPAFYLDRFTRLAPQFYTYLALSFIGAAAFGFRHQWMSEAPSLWHLTLMASIVPLDFYTVFLRDMLLPPTWSLGLEAMFYALFPFILILRGRLVFAAASFLVFLAAYGGLLNTDLYGYRYLPGTLFIFLCGSWLHTPDARFGKRLPLLFGGLSAILLLVTFVRPALAVPFNRDVLLGIGLGLPAVHALQKAHIRSKADALCGNLSYGVFLSHTLIIAAVETLGGIKLSGTLATIALCAMATAASYLTFTLVEEPLIAWRRRLRDARMTANDTPQPFAPARRVS